MFLYGFEGRLEFRWWCNFVPREWLWSLPLTSQNPNFQHGNFIRNCGNSLTLPCEKCFKRVRAISNQRKGDTADQKHGWPGNGRVRNNTQNYKRRSPSKEKCSIPLTNPKSEHIGGFRNLCFVKGKKKVALKTHGGEKSHQVGIPYFNLAHPSQNQL